MKRLFACLIMAGVLVACGGNAEEKPAETTAPTEAAADTTTAAPADTTTAPAPAH
ncbi:MAG: hypothetical protein QM539_06680 [Alphaproteobacteria bacterium]|nr:hypothetical protein [Alphaproteobacteria bacterium]